MFGSRRIYLDYASATPLSAESARAMREAAAYVGNPGAIHAEGVAAKRALDDARERIARTFECKPRELVFTSGATEANNLALVGLARRLERVHRTLSGTHWIVSAIEHPSTLASFEEIERLGGAVSHIEPDARGIITEDAVRALLRNETVCVSIGWSNSEIGTIQPLSHIALVIRAHEKAKKTRVVFHADAGQAPLYLSTTIHSLGVDLLTLDSAKLYGPHGIGLLYVAPDTDLSPILFGGSQERGLRPGTENVMLAAGFAAALERLQRLRHVQQKRIEALRDELVIQLRKAFPPVVFNGDARRSLPHIVNISLPDIASEYVVLSFDHAGIAVSTKSACREGEEQESHVVRALGGEPWRARNTIRISLGEGTRMRDCTRFVSALKSIVASRQAPPSP